MCGITGFTGSGSRETLDRMTRTLIHRGPDDEGYFFQPGRVALGFRRLAIIDLTTGNQPVFNEDRSVAVLMNGEIYNFKSLRAELEKRHTFRTSGDTEVIPHLYEELGERVFEYLNGMFAIALWDTRERKFILARDRFGKKPLYYANVLGAFVFGSEPKAILAHPAVRAELDLEALNLYLTHEYVPGPRSIFKGIFKVPAGSILRFRAGSVDIRPYYRVEFGRVELLDSLDGIVRMFDERLAQAVEARLVSDVPLGAFLSGGLDSSTVSYYAQQALGQRLKTFSIGFRDPAFDESRYARAVANHLGTEHHLETIDAQDLLRVLPEITAKLDEPLGDATVIPAYVLSRFARRSVTAVLGGDGGDELLMGYPTFQANRLADWYLSLPRFIRDTLIRPLVMRLPVSSGHISLDYRLKRFLLGLDYPPLHRDLIWIGSFTPPEKRELLTPTVLRELENLSDFSVIDGYRREVSDRSFWEQITYLYIKTYMQDDTLFLKDRASMFASLELRAPFLDYRLVDFINSVPVRLKLHGFTVKYLLKRLMAGRLPWRIVHRKKKGFGVPVARWLREELKPLMLETLGRRRIERDGLFRYPVVERLIGEHLAGRRDNRKLLWTLMMFHFWKDRWLPA